MCYTDCIALRTQVIRIKFVRINSMYYYVSILYVSTKNVEYYLYYYYEMYYTYQICTYVSQLNTNKIINPTCAQHISTTSTYVATVFQRYWLLFRTVVNSISLYVEQSLFVVRK